MKYEPHNHSPPTTSVIIFLRYPRPGKVKTRLAASLGEETAANLYRLCAEHVFQECLKLPAEVQQYVFYTEKDTEDEVKRWVGPRFHFCPQVEGNLGTRIEHAFRTVFKEGRSKAIILASDVPDISAGIISSSIDVLDHHDIVIGPSHDGGYYLLGMKKMHRGLFHGIRWGTEQVYNGTLHAAQKLGLSVLSLQQLIDIDTKEDLSTWLKLTSDDQHSVLTYARTRGLQL